MACCNPVTERIQTKAGTWRTVTFGCGKCDACLKKRQRDWIFRCSYEARKFPYNWIVTLTYSDEWLTFTKKGNATLNKRDFQLFMKRLRADYSGYKIRYLVRGEYGGKFGRPHFHLILFGFPGHSKEEVGWKIQQQWHYGGIYVDSYSDKAVNYVTSYILKADDMSVYQDEEIVKPYINVSQRPPIGANFLDSQTARRAIKNNDYMIITENLGEISIPRTLAKKADISVVGNDDYAIAWRRELRKKIIVNKEKTHYGENYRYHKQVERAEAIQQQRHREYIKNKSKN